MSNSDDNPYSAAEQALGYIYQGRFALLQLLRLPENQSLLMEKDDDLDFMEDNGTKSLASLKHKAVAHRLTDLSVDFWKSANIWLFRYKKDGKIASNLRFFLFTTSSVAEGSFLNNFLPSAPRSSGFDAKVELADRACELLENSTSKTIAKIRERFDELDRDEQADFFTRIVILENGERIDQLSGRIINQHFRTIPREYRQPIFERLEGWWNALVIDLLTGLRQEPVFGYEVSDKLAAMADEYKLDNLPITISRALPKGGAPACEDQRMFVRQLREIQISGDRLQSAILDYYRAFEQRSVWAREELLMVGEMGAYEDKLVDEWIRYKDVAFDELENETLDAVLIKAGKSLYKWSEFDSGHLKIRERVSEAFVIRGTFHMLANESPLPRIHWHPHFLHRIRLLLGEKS